MDDISNNLQPMSTETIDQIIQQKMTEMFTAQFESLKDKVVTVIANKISSLLEENKTLRTEIQQLRETRESEKKELSIVHQLVTTFNTKLGDVQKEQDNAIQEMTNKVQLISTRLEIEDRVLSMEENGNNESKHAASMQKLVDGLHSKIKDMEEEIAEAKQSTQDELKSISETVKVMLSEVPQCDAIINKFIELEESVKEANNKCDNFEDLSERVSLIETCETSTQPVYSTASLICSTDLIGELASELEERQKRMKSLVIHNVPESRTEEEDFDTVAGIVNTVTGKELDSTKASITKIYRMGRKNHSKGRSIKVHFTTSEMSTYTLENARKLSRAEKYKTVVVQKDLTPLERLNLKKLLTEKSIRNLNETRKGEEADCIILAGIMCRKQDFYSRN